MVLKRNWPFCSWTHIFSDSFVAHHNITLLFGTEWLYRLCGQCGCWALSCQLRPSCFWKCLSCFHPCRSFSRLLYLPNPWRRLTLSCWAQAQWCGLSAQLLRGMWDLPRPRIKPVSPSLVGGFLTTGPAGKSLIAVSFRYLLCVRCWG